MAGRSELGLPEKKGCSLKERLAHTTLRNVRQQGHTYVELREDRKRLIFFCTLCLSPCYSDSVLFAHLKGSLHTERLTAAKATLLKENPWPFNDGMAFFTGTSEIEDKSPVVIDERSRLLDALRQDEKTLAIVSYRDNTELIESESAGPDSDSDAGDIIDGKDNNHLVIPGVLCKDEVSDIEITHMGVGRISARVCEKVGTSREIRRIWCEWLGKKDFNEYDTLMVPDHEFSIVTFPYNYGLGRKGLFGDVRYLLPSSPNSELEDDAGSRNKKRKSFSDPEDAAESSGNQYDSAGEESQSSNNSNLKLLLHGYDDQLHSRILLSKTLRKELRRQNDVASHRTCDICQHRMLPGKDVAALLNMNTGRLACSSRNTTGAFHVFHISCLIHWILFCEVETDKQLIAPEVKQRSRKRSGAKHKGRGKYDDIQAKQIYSVFCPECQGTGIKIHGDMLQTPAISLSEIFRYKLKVSDGRKGWMKNPEVLDNCSTGLGFPPQSEDACQLETVSPMKLLRFYRANA